MDEFAPYLKINGCFVVLNTAPQIKTIKIFNYPILYGQTRDLLQIPGVAESDIRASLLKGELQHKIRAQDITVICSDIDLLQFNSNQKTFLQGAGIVNGLDSTSTIQYLFKQNIPLIGLINNVNRIFKIPSPDKFIDGIFSGNEFHIQVLHNNISLTQSQDFTISESGGVSTGYDTITIISFTPTIDSFISASYVVKL